MKARRLFNHSPELAGDVKIKGVATVSFDTLPFNSTTKLLRTGNKINWHALLTGANEDDDMEIVVKATQIDLLNVLEIDK